jgi:transcription antitermination factor NusG
LSEDRIFVADFVRAIAPGAMREPLWYTVRYVSGKEKIFTWLLDYIALPFQHLTYLQKVKKTKNPVERSWLPGYMFINVDIRRDNWSQILRMPYALEVLGDPTPLPHGVVDDLVLRLPLRPNKPSAFSCVAPGTRVKLRKGAFAGHEGPVTWSERRKLKVMLMLFNAPREVQADVSDVEVL